MSTFPVVHLRDLYPRQKIFTAWEKQRHRREVHWVMECFAEMLGVFFYVYAGVGSQAGFVMGTILNEPTSSQLQIGFAYCFGILFAIGVCSGTSGGHFNPAISICFVIFKGFPKMKAVRYILAQILGAFVACMLVYMQHKFKIDSATAVLREAGTLEAVLFTPGGPAGVFGTFLPSGQTLALSFLNEFVTDAFIALVIWATFDPTNILIPPSVGPAIVSLAYANAIWGFGAIGLSANTARDLGGRLMALLIWGTGAAGGLYAASSTLTNIPATIFAVCIYEFFLTDSDRVLPIASLEHTHIKLNHRREREEFKRNAALDLEKQMNMVTPDVEDTTYELKAPRVF